MLEKIVGVFGGNPTQFTHLLKAEKTVEARALQKTFAVNLTLTLNCIVCVFMSIAVAIIVVVFSGDVFTYAFFCISMCMMSVGFWTIPYFDRVLSPVHYPVIAHTPVSSRTYFLVKLTPVVKHTVLLILCSSLIPAIAGIFNFSGEFLTYRYLFPVIYLLIAFISGFFTIGVMTTFAGYITKFHSIKSLRNITQFAQLVIPLLFLPLSFLLYSLLPNLIPDDFAMGKFKITSKWLYLVPNGWFAGMVSFIHGQMELYHLMMTLLAVASTLFLVFFPLRSIARSYSEYLSYLLESGTKQNTKMQVRIPLLALIIPTSTIRASFCLSIAYLLRDKRIRLGLVGAFGAIAGFVVIFALPGGLSVNPKWFIYAFIIGLSPGFSFAFIYVGISFVDSFILPVRYSEHYKASWMLKVTPILKRQDLWKGVQTTVLLYIVAPWTLIGICIATLIWKFHGILYILPALIIILNYVMLYPKPRSNLPLAEEYVQKRVTIGMWRPFLCTMATIVFLFGIQFLTYWIGVWTYIVTYCVIVVGGLTCFTYLFTRKTSEVNINA